MAMYLRLRTIIPKITHWFTLMSLWTMFISWQYRTASTMIFMYYLTWIVFELPDLILSEFSFLTDLSIKLPSFHVLKDQDDSILLFEDFVNVDDTRMVQSNQNVNFVLRLQNLVLVYFNSIGLPWVLPDCFSDCTGCSVFN